MFIQHLLTQYRCSIQTVLLHIGLNVRSQDPGYRSILRLAIENSRSLDRESPSPDGSLGIPEAPIASLHSPESIRH